MTDVEIAIDRELMTGLSPGFVVPAPEVIPGAETIEIEPGTGVEVRVLNAVVLRELSIVTNPAYGAGLVELRNEELVALLERYLPADEAERADVIGRMAEAAGITRQHGASDTPGGDRVSASLSTWPGLRVRLASRSTTS